MAADPQQKVDYRAQQRWRELHGATFLVLVFLALFVAGLVLGGWEFIRTFASIDGKPTIKPPDVTR